MIGGEYYFDEHVKPYEIQNSVERFIENHVSNLVFFSTGRDAIYALVKGVKNKRIWLPEYLCQSIYMPIKACNKEIHYYQVDEKLEINCEFIEDMNENDCVFIINYFGCIQKEIYEILNEKKCSVISDITHLFFNLHAMGYALSYSNYVICSLRKFGPLPDGAFIGGETDKIELVQKECRDSFAYLRAGAFVSRRYSQLNHFENDENYKILKCAEDLLDQTEDFGCTMSYMTKQLLKRLDYWELAQITKHNFEVFLYSVNQNIHYEVLNKEHVFSFVVVSFETEELRNEVKYRLRNERVFCPIHWDTSWMEKEHINSKKLLSFPCDYRYKQENMIAIAKTLNQILEEIF